MLGQHFLIQRQHFLVLSGESKKVDGKDVDVRMLGGVRGGGRGGESYKQRERERERGTINCSEHQLKVVQ